MPTHSNLKPLNFIELLNQFINECSRGKHLQKNGKRLTNASIDNYRYLRQLIWNFTIAKNFDLRLLPVNKMNKRQFIKEKNYWKKFYKKFTDYLYHDLNVYDNYVGSNIKLLRVFFNYLNEEKGINVGNFHKSFYVCKEEIPIITLLPEQLNYLIYNKEFASNLSERLRKTKDVFVFGCTVALRVSDIMSLKRFNLEQMNGQYYLKVISRKTETLTRIKLPDYAVAILKKYKNKYKTLFPPISLFNLNKNIRLLIEAAGWTDPYAKTRHKRGIPVSIYKDSNKNTFRFCDLISSHTMRRTAITTMLCLGMPEHLVRKISGHSANSTEFFRYVALSQLYIDREVEKVYEKLTEKVMLTTTEI